MLSEISFPRYLPVITFIFGDENVPPPEFPQRVFFVFVFILVNRLYLQGVTGGHAV